MIATRVNDFGAMLNPLVVEGQIHGGVQQGLGQALLERTVYDAEDQLLTGSFTDYAMPRASDAPAFVTAFDPVPAKTNPLGVKGCGEAGVTAVVDARSELGVRHLDMPFTPLRVWQAIQAARANSSRLT